MEKFIVIKFGELFLKGKNRSSFSGCLFKNVKRALKGFEFNLVNKNNMFFLFFEQENENEILDILKMIPGISYIHICYMCETDINKIEELACKLCEGFKTFKIEIKRKHKNFMERDEIISSVARKILSNREIVVDVNNPELLLTIEIHSSKDSYIWTDKIKGIGGLPIGVNGSCLSLLSGGIDSPVASFQVQKRGQIVDYLTFITEDVTEKTIDKLKKLINKITLNNKIHNAKLYVIDYTKVQHELMHMSNPKYRITLMRRSFYRIAQEIALKNNYDALVCGDSLGQVASQTLESINTISNVCDKMQIFRPLLTFDKQEIIEIAKKIDTYETSIGEHEDVCSMFAPQNPATKPSVKLALSLENELKLLNYIEQSVINKIKIINVE